MNPPSDTAVQPFTSQAPAGVPSLQTRQGQDWQVPGSFQEAWQWSQALAKAGAMLPSHFQNKPEACLVAIAKGARLGVDPITACQNLSVIDGRATWFGHFVAGLVIQHPDCESYDVWNTDENGERWDPTAKGSAKLRGAVCVIKRRGRPEVREPFTMEQAHHAGLTSKATWKQYPDAMLKRRAAARAAYAAFPDLLAGVPCSDLHDGTDGAPETMDVLESVQAPPSMLGHQAAEPRVVTASPAAVAEAPASPATGGVVPREAIQGLAPSPHVHDAVVPLQAVPERAPTPLMKAADDLAALFPATAPATPATDSVADWTTEERVQQAEATHDQAAQQSGPEQAAEPPVGQATETRDVALPGAQAEQEKPKGLRIQLASGMRTVDHVTAKRAPRSSNVKAGQLWYRQEDGLLQSAKTDGAQDWDPIGKYTETDGQLLRTQPQASGDAAGRTLEPDKPQAPQAATQSTAAAAPPSTAAQPAQPSTPQQATPAEPPSTAQRWSAAAGRLQQHAVALGWTGSQLLAKAQDITGGAVLALDQLTVDQLEALADETELLAGG